MRTLILLPIIFLGLMSVLHGQSTDRSLDGELIYTRDNGDVRQYVHVGEQEQVFTLPGDKCSRISYDGKYIATTSPQEDDLVIRRLKDLTVVATVAWNPQWEPCRNGWNGSIYSAPIKNTENQYFEYNVITGNGEVIIRQPSPPSFSDLPEHYPSSDADFLVESPTGTHVLYEKCVRADFDPTLGPCLSDVEFVVYDVVNNTEVESLASVDRFLLTGVDDLNRGVSSGGVAWSPNGRYIAYSGVSGGPGRFFDLAMYDLQTDSYPELDFLNFGVDYWRPMEWSPDSTKLVFWFTPGDLYPGDTTPRDEAKSFAILDIATNTFKTPGRAFSSTDRPFVTWSPDSSGFVFRDSNNDMYFIDAVTGASTVVDSHVIEIVSWNEFEPIAEVTK